eukprot:COSAG05_NODE_18690_length_304_cov_1.248780_1_plen_100_part_11
MTQSRPTGAKHTEELLNWKQASQVKMAESKKKLEQEELAQLTLTPNMKKSFGTKDDLKHVRGAGIATHTQATHLKTPVNARVDSISRDPSMSPAPGPAAT